jgi:two-component system, response regulator YesN
VSKHCVLLTVSLFEETFLNSSLTTRETIVDRRICAAVKRIHANGYERILISDLARSVNMSRWRFCHVFKTEMSLSPSDYISTLRMREAERLLGETFLSVKEIRAALGNLDRTHFSRTFKKYCGLTPTQFRRRLARNFEDAPTQHAAK